MRSYIHDIHLVIRTVFDGRVKIGTRDTLPKRGVQSIAAIKMYGSAGGTYNIEDRIRAMLITRQARDGWYTVTEVECRRLAVWLNSINGRTLAWYDQANDTHPLRFSAVLDRWLNEIDFADNHPAELMSTADRAIGALSMATG